MEILKEIVKNTTTEQIEEYYKRRNKKLLNQNKKLRESALDISAGGGLVNTYLTRGIFRKDFSTPLAQSLISEEMANEGYFSLALQQFTALCRDVDLELSYNSRELNKDKKHKFVLDFVRKQINNIGGLNNIFEKVIKPSLRWGVGIGLPSFQTDGQYIGFKSIKTINMQNIQQFIFDKDDSSRLAYIKYITFPKVVNTGLENLLDNEMTSVDMTDLEYITIGIKENCIAYCPHGNTDGDPFGVPYLYFLYSYYKQYKKISESMYNALHSFGNYPLGVSRGSRESGVDNNDWEEAIIDKLNDLMNQGGGIFVDGEGQLYNLTPPDTSNMTESMKSIFDIVMRTASLGQITSGIDGGGSRNLMRSMDLMTDSFVKATVQKACLNISETMIRNLCYLNFKKDYKLNKLKEFPYLLIKENSIIMTEIKEEADKKIESQSNQNNQNMPFGELKTEQVKQSKLKDVIETEGYSTTFKIVKQDTNDLEKSIRIDAKSLDDMLVRVTEELSDLLSSSLRPKMKVALEKIAKNPKANLNIWGLFDKKAFENNIKSEIEHIVKQFALENAKYIEGAFELGNTSFLEQLGVDISEYAETVANKYLKSKAIKTITDTFIQEASNYVRDYAVKVSSGFSLNNKDLRANALRRALSDVDALKGVEFEKLAEQTVISTFTNFTEYENKEAVKHSKNKNYVMFRSGILEGQCSHCSEKMGEVYYPTEDGDNYLNDKGEYLTLPDPDCKGMRYGNKCRCFAVLTPKGYIGAK